MTLFSRLIEHLFARKVQTGKDNPG